MKSFEKANEKKRGGAKRKRKNKHRGAGDFKNRGVF